MSLPYSCSCTQVPVLLSQPGAEPLQCTVLSSSEEVQDEACEVTSSAMLCVMQQGYVSAQIC